MKAKAEYVGGFGNCDQCGQAKLDKIRDLTVAVGMLREALDSISHIGDGNPDCNHCGEYLDARNAARSVLSRVSSPGLWEEVRWLLTNDVDGDSHKYPLWSRRRDAVLKGGKA